MSNKIAGLMVYVVRSGDPQLVCLIVGAMHEIETSDCAAQAAKGARIAASAGVALSGLEMMRRLMQDFSQDCKAMINEAKLW